MRAWTLLMRAATVTLWYLVVVSSSLVLMSGARLTLERRPGRLSASFSLSSPRIALDASRCAYTTTPSASGAGVKAEANRLEAERLMVPGIKFYSWNAGAKVLNEDERVEDSNDGEVPTNKEFFMNLKAQAWWNLRRRFERTHRAITEGVKYPVDDMISIPSTLPKLRTLQKELSQPTSKKSTTMKLLVDKKPEGTKSPNIADALVMCFFPVETTSYDQSLDWV
jgi:hypothetical protein